MSKKAPPLKEPPSPSCSFCGKSKDEVACLVAGPSVFICDECVSLSHDIMAEEIDRDSSVRKRPGRLLRFAVVFGSIADVLEKNPKMSALAAEARVLASDLHDAPEAQP